MPKKKKDDDNYYQSEEYKKFSEQRRKKYNEQIANGEIKGEIKKVSPFCSRFENEHLKSCFLIPNFSPNSLFQIL